MSDDKYFKWASQSRVDPIYGTNNYLEPPDEKKTYGFDPGEILPNNWFNYLIQYLTARSNAPVNTVIADLPLNNERPVAYQLYVTDASGGACIVYNDGTDWRRIKDDTVVS